KSLSLFWLGAVHAFVHFFIHRRYFLSPFENTCDKAQLFSLPMKKQVRARASKWAYLLGALPELGVLSNLVALRLTLPRLVCATDIESDGCSFSYTCKSAVRAGEKSFCVRFHQLAHRER